jgi:hypothetical protein
VTGFEPQPTAVLSLTERSISYAISTVLALTEIICKDLAVPRGCPASGFFPAQPGSSTLSWRLQERINFYLTLKCGVCSITKVVDKTTKELPKLP